MQEPLKILFSFIIITSAKCKEPKLPLCPSNINYFPQNLPMHCRMPRSAKFSSSPMPNFPPFPQPFPIAPGFPPPGMQMPPGGPALPMPPPGGIPPMMPMSMPMPMPLQAPGPAHKLPVIVMPFYSPDPSFKNPSQSNTKRKKVGMYQEGRRPGGDTSYESDTDTDTDTHTDSSSSSGSSNEARGWWKSKRGFRRANKRVTKRKHKPRRRKHGHYKDHLLTPILQYVTKDGYVIYEKKISKNEAGEWLEMNGADTNNKKQPVPQYHEVEMVHASTVDDDADIDKATTQSEVSKEEVTTTRVQHTRKHRVHKRIPIKAHLQKQEENEALNN